MKDVEKFIGHEEQRRSIRFLRKQYGSHINRFNLFMPLSHYLPIALRVQANITFYKGVKTSTLPSDAWVYHELIWKERPTVIVEIGNFHGGSTMMLSDYMMGTPEGRLVIGVDIDHSQLFQDALEYPNIKWIEGDANHEDMLGRVKSLIQPDDKVMVVDDSNHQEEHTYQVLKSFAPLVTKNQYFIVEDTLIGGILPRHHGEFGADVAVARFLKETDEFEPVTYWQKWFITNNPGGFLRRVKNEA
jgi:cephalosporin hydroxylase